MVVIKMDGEQHSPSPSHSPLCKSKVTPCVLEKAVQTHGKPPVDLGSLLGCQPPSPSSSTHLITALLNLLAIHDKELERASLLQTLKRTQQHHIALVCLTEHTPRTLVSSGGGEETPLA